MTKRSETVSESIEQYPSKKTFQNDQQAIPEKRGWLLYPEAEMTVSITISSPFVETPSSSSSTTPIWATFAGALLNCQDCSIQLQIQPSIALKCSAPSEGKGEILLNKFYAFLTPRSISWGGEDDEETLVWINLAMPVTQQQ